MGNEDVGLYLLIVSAAKSHLAVTGRVTFPAGASSKLILGDLASIDPHEWSNES
jgi:hypothetical protein